MIAFIDDHREAHGVEPICKVLPTAPSTYYDHVARRRDPARLSALAKREAEQFQRVSVRNRQAVLSGLNRRSLLAPTCFL